MCCIATKIHLTTSLIQLINEHLETIVRGKNQLKKKSTNLKILHINAMMDNFKKKHFSKFYLQKTFTVQSCEKNNL
jgi:hypothetical protein